MSPTENPSAAPPKRILVADDERYIVPLIERALVNAGYEVITAYDAAEAYEKARTERPDVILLDSILIPEPEHRPWCRFWRR